jgi:hypothetical protein
MEEKHHAQKLQEWREQRAQIRVNLERAKPQPSASIVPGASPPPRPERSEERVQAQADPSPKPATSTLPCHDFKPPRHTESSAPRSTPRKPPKSATPVPKAHKNAAHAAKYGYRNGAGILIEAETVGLGRDGTFTCLSEIRRRQERGASRVSQVSSRSPASVAGLVVHEKIRETELAGQV